MKIITPASAEPISMEMARKQCRVDPEGSPPTHEDDELIAVFLTAAREWCEDELGMNIAPAIAETSFDDFPGTTTITNSVGTTATSPGVLALESGPVLGILSIKYLDTDGLEQEVDWTTYYLDTDDQVAVVRLFTGDEDDEPWPTSNGTPNNVKVRYSIGYSLPTDSPQDAPLPARIKAAILLVLGHLYQNRSNTVEKNLAEIPLGAAALLSPLKLRKGFA